jgi:hypothetical protein
MFAEAEAHPSIAEIRWGGMETDLSQRPGTSTQLTAFVDASVIAAYLKGSDAPADLALRWLALTTI